MPESQNSDNPLPLAGAAPVGGSLDEFLGAVPPAPTASPVSPAAFDNPKTLSPTVLARIVTWSEDGVAVVKNVPMLTKNQVSEIIVAAASQAYVPDPHDPRDQEFAGLTNMEVMTIRQMRNAARTGDSRDIEDIRDRILGKPKFTGEVLNIKMGYEDALREIERKDLERRREFTPASVVPTPPNPVPPRPTTIHDFLAEDPLA